MRRLFTATLAVVVLAGAAHAQVNPSVGVNNASGPGASTQIGVQDGTGKLQPVSSVNPLPISGSISATNPSVGNTGSTVPSVATNLGAQNGANLVNLKADASNNLDINCQAGCNGSNASVGSTGAAVPSSGTYLAGTQGGNLTGLTVGAHGGLVVEGVTSGAAQAVAGDVAAGAADSGNPVKVGGVYLSAQTTVSTGQRKDLQVDSTGDLRTLICRPDYSGVLCSNVFTPTDANSGSMNALSVFNIPGLFNGSTYDRQRSNFDTGALATLSSQAAGNGNSADQTNYNGRGVQVGVNITAASSMTLTVCIQGKDIASGVYYSILCSSALASTGFTNMTVFPGAASTANVSSPQVLPHIWRISWTVTGTSVTGTVGASVIN